VQANVRREVTSVLEAENLLRSLIPAWEEAVRQQTAKPSGEGSGAARGTGSVVSLNG
jgi:flagellin-specific chaperone FliS